METKEQFTVTRPIESVWELSQVVPKLARCLRDAELASDDGNGAYDGRIAARLGSVSSSFDGGACIVFDHDALGAPWRMCSHSW